MNVFDIIKNLTQYKKKYENLSEEEIKNINPYMINRFFSMDKNLIELVNYIQFIPYEDKKLYYKIYFELLPKKSLWLQYLKSKNKEPNKELLEHLSKYWECSMKDTKENIKILDKKEIIDILKSLGVEDKEIKILLK